MRARTALPRRARRHSRLAPPSMGPGGATSVLACAYLARPDRVRAGVSPARRSSSGPPDGGRH
ncbi:hypothetical protein [Nonomuraea sp. LPB2021202275-12-8]|uniref:hypothetical protein n=1 Tax=Nonomuraea sp. LPB2021202275-12-8 TaxID=3120159 RepID=UPI00300DA0DF